MFVEGVLRGLGGSVLFVRGQLAMLWLWHGVLVFSYTVYGVRDRVGVRVLVYAVYGVGYRFGWGRLGAFINPAYCLYAFFFRVCILGIGGGYHGGWGCG